MKVGQWIYSIKQETAEHFASLAEFINGHSLKNHAYKFQDDVQQEVVDFLWKELEAASFVIGMPQTELEIQAKSQPIILISSKMPASRKSLTSSEKNWKVTVLW